MADDPPKLRLVDPDERAPEPSVTPDAEPSVAPPPVDDRHPLAWMSAAIPLCIGIAILVVGLAVALRLLMDTGRSDDDRGDTPAATRPIAPTSSIDPLSLLPRAPTSAGESTTIPPSTAPPTVAPTTVPRNVDPALIPLPVGGSASPSPAPATVPAPATGTARIRIFNGFSQGETLDLWEVSGPTPVRYGTMAYGALVEMVAGGRLLPSGVSLKLRFVRPGGDPMGAIEDGVSSKTGPWGRNFTPLDGSTVTLMLSRNPGLRVVPIDDARAAVAVQPGRVHVVPVVQHLASNNLHTQWAADGIGCLGELGVDGELDLDVGTALRLAAVDDPTCSDTLSDPIVLDRSGAFAVVGLALPGGRAQLLSVPLG